MNIFWYKNYSFFKSVSGSQSSIVSQATTVMLAVLLGCGSKLCYVIYFLTMYATESENQCQPRYHNCWIHISGFLTSDPVGIIVLQFPSKTWLLVDNIYISNQILFLPHSQRTSYGFYDLLKLFHFFLIFSHFLWYSVGYISLS